MGHPIEQDPLHIRQHRWDYIEYMYVIALVLDARSATRDVEMHETDDWLLKKLRTERYGLSKESNSPII